MLAIACDVLVCFVGYNDPYGLTVAGQANRVLRAAVCRYWDEQEAAETTEEDLDDPLWVLPSGPLRQTCPCFNAGQSRKRWRQRWGGGA